MTTTALIPAQRQVPPKQSQSPQESQSNNHGREKNHNHSKTAGIIGFFAGFAAGIYTASPDVQQACKRIWKARKHRAIDIR